MRRSTESRQPREEEQAVEVEEVKAPKEETTRASAHDSEQRAELIAHLSDINKQIEDLGLEISVLKEQSASPYNRSSIENESIISANEKALEKLKQERAEFEEKTLSKEERTEIARIRSEMETEKSLEKSVALEKEISKEKVHPILQEVTKMYFQTVIQEDIEKAKTGVMEYRAKGDGYLRSLKFYELLLKDLEDLRKVNAGGIPKESSEQLLGLAEKIYQITKKEADNSLKERRDGIFFKKDLLPGLTAEIYTFLAKMAMDLGHDPGESFKKLKDSIGAEGAAEIKSKLEADLETKDTSVSAEKIADSLKRFLEKAKKIEPKIGSYRPDTVELHRAVLELDFSYFANLIRGSLGTFASSSDHISLVSDLSEILVALARVPSANEAEAQQEVEEELKKAA